MVGTFEGVGAPVPRLDSGSATVSTVVLVMTDVEASTRLWAEQPAGMNSAMARHHEVLHGAITTHGGWRPVDQGEGDAVFAAFDSGAAAVAAVVEAQRAFAAEVWPDGIDLKVRIGVHAGEVISRGGNLFGSTVNRCARIRGLGAGGQVLLSAPAFELVRDNLPDGVTVIDLGEHRMKDLTRPESIYQLKIPALTADFPLLSSLDRARHNLPVQTSSFLGRTREIRELVELVGRERLVTIVGFGGMGKTRLALQVAAELATGDGDGVWFVDLSAVTDPSQMPGLIATTLGIGEDGDGILSGLLTGLRGKRLLLVLDNLEQLLPEAADLVAQLLRAGSDVRILATSREALRISGEQQYLLEPLPIPPVTPARADWTDAELGSLSTYDAVRLFLTRAAAVRRDLILTASNAAAVAAICARLDGMPLALELAAARVRVLSPEALLSRLDNALTVLGSGNRDLPSRQRTLRATIAWSYDALQPDEQRLLDRLSVFPGTFTLDAAEHICGPGIADEEQDIDVLEGVSTLVDRSLLQHHDATDGGDDRDSLLVSIREYVGEHLDQHGETSAIMGRHAAYYGDLTDLPADYSPEDARQRRRRIVGELHNLRLALAHRRHDASPGPNGRRLALVVAQMLDGQGRCVEEREVINEELEDSAIQGGYRIELLLGKANVERRLGLQAEFEQVTEQVLAAARENGDLSLILAALTYQALASHKRATVRAVFDEADTVIARLPALGTTLARWDALIFWNYNLAMHVFTDPERAIGRLTAPELVGSDPVEVELGGVLVSLGRWAEAEPLLIPYEQSPVIRDVDALSAVNGAFHAARMRLATGHLMQASIDLDLAGERLALIDSPSHFKWDGFIRAAVDRAAGNRRGAMGRLDQMIGQLPSDPDPTEAAQFLWLSSVLARESGAVAEAERRLLRAWSLAAGWDAMCLDLILECLLERATQVCDTKPAESVRLIGLVREHQGPFVFLDGVDYDTDAMLTELRRRLGEHEVQDILDSTVGQPLPDKPVFESLIE